MRRRPFAILSALSLLLMGVAMAALWVHSGVFGYGDEVFCATGGRTLWHFFSGYGYVRIHHVSEWPDPPGVVYRTVRVYGTDTGETPSFWPQSPYKFDLWLGVVEWGRESITLKNSGPGVDWGQGPPVGFGLNPPWRWSPAFPYWSVSVNYWFLFILLALRPFRRWMRRYKSARRSRLGFCPACGYDLTGNASGTCPECGLPVRVKPEGTTG